jgi:hypothetical protein
MRETPRRRISVTSSLYEIFTEQLVNRVVVRGLGMGGVTQPPTTTPLDSRFLGKNLKTTWTVFHPITIFAATKIPFRPMLIGFLFCCKKTVFFLLSLDRIPDFWLYGNSAIVGVSTLLKMFKNI